MSAAPLDIVVLGLSLSSSWGNGHATTYRALLRALAGRGHRILFLERDMPWYASNRDMPEPEFCRLGFYDSVAGLRRWTGAVAAADAVIVGSYVPDGIAVGDMVLHTATGVTAFYDIDTPITLAALARGSAEYIAPSQIGAYDLYLSFTGGPTLARLETQYGARQARALYCSADTRPVTTALRWDLSYLGTYSPDRQDALERLLLAPARRAPTLRFAVAGAQFPDSLAWPGNVERIDHVAPEDHARFYGASRYTLNLTRAEMRRAGHSPSVRLFEAAACGTPILSDDWPGLGTLFEAGTEILLPDGTEAVLHILQHQPEAERRAIAEAARRKVLAGHTPRRRAAQLECWLREARAARPAIALAREG